ncbi:phage terminase large subunit family protein [Lysinibacillus fusiformis]|uniref:IS1/IS1595 family N-terminal zinc-binding domain-containing protein n=1 Tax=Lysinibacillus fusiformis TaxID=28031 RepID=UPI003AFAB5CB
MGAISMKCLYCGCVAHKHGKTQLGKQRYKCSNCPNCGKTFNEDGDRKVFIINCPKCEKEIEGFKFGKVWYFDAKGISKQRYRCSGCGAVTVNYVRTEERG